jgi:signal transduction histidine kinase
MISHNLMPPVLDLLGLPASLRTMLAKVAKSSDIEFDIQVQDSAFMKKLPKDAALSLYRIAQELLNNALKHSQAAKIGFALYHDSKYLHLEILDNGKGLKKVPKNTKKKSGIGFATIEGRLRLLGGEIQLEPSTKGTHFHVRVPTEQLVEGSEWE